MTLSGADPTAGTTNAARPLTGGTPSSVTLLPGPSGAASKAAPGQPLPLIYTYQYYV